MKTASEGWPSDTFVQARRRKFHNGEAVEIFHMPNAVTDADSIVHFRRSDVFVTGDIFNLVTYPHIDVKNGGSIQGELDALNFILDRTVYKHDEEDGTMIIPGHGRVCDEWELAEYRDMLVIIRDRVQDLIRKRRNAGTGSGGACNRRLRHPLWRHIRTLDNRDVRGSCLYQSEEAARSIRRKVGLPRTMDLGGLDLNLLVALDALFAEKSVSRAGERLHLSQSATSGALARLREVFQRSAACAGRTQNGSDTGRRSAGGARAGFSAAGGGDSQQPPGIRSRHPPRESFGFLCPTTWRWCSWPKRLPRIEQFAPGIRFEFVSNFEGGFEALDRGEIDLSIAPSHSAYLGAPFRTVVRR